MEVRILRIFSRLSKNKTYKLSESKNFKMPNEIVKQIYEDIDSIGSIPLDLGLYLEKLIINQERDDYYIGTHNSSAIRDENVFENETLKSICNDGLINNGDLSSGVHSEYGYNSISKTVAQTKTILNLLFNLKSEYKGGRGAFILKFPKEYFNEEFELKAGMENMVYNIKNGMQYIKPEFILGFVARDKNDNFI